MNESETRAELIDPKLNAAGWTTENNCKIFREFVITNHLVGSHQKSGLKADYVLSYNNVKLAVIEAKKADMSISEGVVQAKLYAKKLDIRYAISTNGNEIYLIDIQTGKEKTIKDFPPPQTLYNNLYTQTNEWQNKFNSIALETLGGTKIPRFYQEIAIDKVLKAVAEKKRRILLTLATGTGKTFIASQIAWKLFKTKWNINFDGQRIPRILFLADRNILADQAFMDFSYFPNDALARIRPKTISESGKVPTNGSIFFTIFQTFMSGENNTPYFGQYPKDFFDFIIIDECHRGAANDESNWRAILEYFSSAYQLGLTATPKRDANVDTYKYFGEPVYTYSLKEGINDGFLTPFRVRRFQTTLDTYIYTKDDDVVEGEVKERHEYVEEDFNTNIEISEREKKRVELFMREINQKEKTIVFGATQEHAGLLRDLINQIKTDSHINYCVRVTANDDEIGEQFLREFRDNEKTIPVILTTSRKLSTGVDARNIRNIVLMRPVKSMIEFKQIIGRGTRLFDGKNYFTIYDFVGAYKNFSDPSWDGEPVEIIDTFDEPKTVCPKCNKRPCECEKEPCKICNQSPCICVKPQPKQMTKIKLADGKYRNIQAMSQTCFWDNSGKPITCEEFLYKLYGDLPKFFKDEQELRNIWSNPDTRKTLLEKLKNAGYNDKTLNNLRELTNTQDSDLFDTLKYIAYEVEPMTRMIRAENAKKKLEEDFDDDKQKAFLEFVLERYIDVGTDELDRADLPNLLILKYKDFNDGVKYLGEDIADKFVAFQKYLYMR
ncbi:MAG: DEAD/DEAH box helicase family protein [Elusimicrobiota bacterium]|jgi:type I restriction enzyme R subunit|nr:DEAD/DEAH box helicase family protein [Elusimicrobiota bacterium]